MSGWAEVNDINCLCTQLITRSEREWEECLDIATENVEAMRIISLATELGKILASVEAVAQAEDA